MFKAVTLSPDELALVISRVAPTGKEYGAARICRLLSQQPLSLTRKVNSECAVGNISDLVTKTINPAISDLDLYVACIKPPQPVYNRFGQPSGQHQWAFFRDGAANQPEYEQTNTEAPVRLPGSDLRAFRGDYDNQYPLDIDDPLEQLANATGGRA